MDKKLEAIAVQTKGGKTEILKAGTRKECMAVAREAALGIKDFGDSMIQVFGPSAWHDNGTARIREENRLANEKAAREAAEKRDETAKEKRVADLKAELATLEPAKKAAKKKAAAVK